MQRIEAILRSEIGLDAASIGSSVIGRALRLRMKLHELKQVEDYERLLANSSEEMNALIEAIVVTETWFMRGREAFAAFADLSLKEWLPLNPDGVMRVLSLPCSSGEEPYSLAMTLLDAGFPADRFSIDAVDISANALVRASNAIYGNNSFRGKHLEFRDRYFVRVEDGYALSPCIQRCVTFHQHNLLKFNPENCRARISVTRESAQAGGQPGSFSTSGFESGLPYDFIFCRNLLIYFDRAMQGVALDKIRSLLAADGVLFVGPAEMPIVTECGFVSAKLSHAFASRKKTRRAESGCCKPVHCPSPVESSSPSSEDASLMEMDRSVSLLVLARRFADAGRLVEAAVFCERHIQENDTSAEGYYLMGLVKDAANDPDAIAYYRKAVYLDPNHYEALIHAAVWLEKSGDVVRADVFKHRAARASQKPQAEP